MAKRRSRFACARFGCFGGQARVDKMAEDGYPVKLHIYDLSQGMARQLSATILGKAIEGIWHTGVVVYGREYYFGGGIQKGEPGRTPYGTPVRVADLGVTHVPREVFEDFLREIGPRYTPATYDLLNHNCNNFSNEAAQFLAGVAVPSYILELPKEVMNSSPLGALILPMVQGLETSLRAGAVPQPPQFRPAPVPVPTASAVQLQPSTNDVEARSTAADKPEAGKTEVDVNDNGSTVVPPAVQPAAPPAAAAQVSAAPTAAATKAAPDAEARSTAGDKPEDGKTAGNDSTVIPPAAQLPAAPPAAAAEASAAPAVAAPPDPLAEAKSRVKEEITREFTAIMASGAARAGEAAALATRRVMERHGLQRAAIAAPRV